MTTDSPLATSLQTYYAAQRVDFIVTGTISLAMIVAAFLLVRRPDGFGRGMAVMLAATALILIAAGVAVQIRNAGMTPALLEAARSPSQSRTAILTQETERMRQLMANFVVARRVYGGLLVVSALAIALARTPLWQGLGAGVTVMTATGFVIDHYAERRADIYLQSLEG